MNKLFLSTVMMFLISYPAFAQVVDESTAQDSVFTGVGTAGANYFAQSFVGDLKVLDTLGVWLKESTPDAEVRIAITGETPGGEPNLSSLIYVSGIIDPDSTGRFYYDENIKVLLQQGTRYYMLIVGLGIFGGSGEAEAGISKDSTDTAEDMIYSNDAGVSWDTLAAWRMALHITGDSCSTAVTISPGDSTYCYDPNRKHTIGSGYEFIYWSTGDTVSGVHFLTTGSYNVVAIDSQGCMGFDTVIAFINPNPVIAITPDTTACDGDSISLWVTAGFTGYTWSNGDSLNTTTVDSAAQYWVNVYTNQACLASDTVQLSYFDLPKPNLGNDTAFCAGEFVVLDAGSGYLGYIWSNGPATRTIIASTTDSFWVNVLDSNQCQGVSDTIHLIRWRLPDQPVIQKNNNQLTSSFALSYAWYFESVLLPTITTQTFIPLNSGNYIVTISDSNGCESTSEPFLVSVDIDVDDIPQGFSPNGDGLNESFWIDGIEFFDNAELTVFNRWGSIVFHQNNYANQWYGNSDSGANLPDGTYFYILNLNSGSPKIEGMIIINR